MSDLIDRQAAIDVINKIFPADPMRNDYTEGITCGAALATEYIKQLPSAQQWTPVSEGLPEKEVEVLVTTSWGNVCMAWCDNGKWRAEYINGYDDDEILAWMPLPEPFKGGGDE